VRFTPRGLRRTANDLAREAKVEAFITKSISGHATERMREHYSTVRAGEQRESIGWVLRLVREGAVTSDHPKVVLRVVLHPPKWCSKTRR
jgi:hypothetical protein